MVRIGIIGIGNMGTGHALSIYEENVPGLKLTAVADSNPKQLEWAERKFSDSIARFDTAEKMLDSGLIDAALVAVPHYEHTKYAIACFERGLHVMVEKPVGVYTKQIRQMNQKAKSANVVFGVMFNQRTDHIYRKMKEIVKDGSLGAIRRTNWIITNWYRPQAYYDSGAWRATWSGEGGGVLMNQCPHNLDLWQWICGMPVTLEAKLHFGKWHDIEVEDDVTAYVEYANGATGVFVTTTGDIPGTNRFEITFEKGKLVAENGQLTLWEAQQREPEFSLTNKNPFGMPEIIMTQLETDGKSEQHNGVLKSFADAILYDKPLIAKGEEGLNGVILSNAMHLSAWMNKKITLPLDEDLYYEELRKRILVSRRKSNVTEILADIKETYNEIRFSQI